MRFAEEHWLWLLLALPLVAALWLWSERQRRAALARWVHPSLWPRLVPGYAPRSIFRSTLTLLALASLIIAAARPQMGSRILATARKGVDVVVALDVSESMNAEDLPPNRLTRARQSVHSLMDRLRGDRIGLVAFAGEAFVQCPLTLDYAAARMFLRYLDTDLIPVPGTAIAGAIRVATKSFDPKETKYKALVLITDGEDHEGEVTAAAREAKAAGVRIFAVALGTEKGEPIPLRDEAGRLIDYKRDERGQVVLTRCDPAVLQQICQDTGGQFFDGNAGDMALEPLYNAISGMEEKELKGGIVTQYEERYAYFIAFGLLLLALEWMLRERKARPRVGASSQRASGVGNAAALLALLVLGGFGVALHPSLARADDGKRAYDAGKYEEARDAYERWLLEHPTDAAARYNLGTALVRTGEMEPAERELQSALRAEDPQLVARSWYNLGTARAKANDLEGARDALRMALRTDPKQADAKANLEIVNQLLQQAPPDSSEQQQQQQQDPQDQPNQDDQQDKPGEPNEGGEPNPDDPQDGQSEQPENSDQQDQQQDSGESDEEEQKREQEEQQGQQEQEQQEQSPEEQPAGAPQPAEAAMSQEEARRLLEALGQQELLLQAERMKAKAHVKNVERDW